MSYVDTIRESIDQYLGDCEGRVQDAIRIAPPMIREAVQRMADRTAYGLGQFIPDSWVDEVADLLIGAALDALNDCLVRIDVLRTANEYLGSPDTLREMGDVYGEIGDEATNLQITKDALQGFMTWDAPPASGQYGVAIEDQITALARVAPAASGVKDVLRTHADDIENYYLSLLGLVVGSVASILGVVGAILSLAGGALTSPTGVGAVLGIIAAALSLVIALVGVVTVGISAVQLFVQSTQGSANKLDALLTSMPTWRVPSFAQLG